MRPNSETLYHFLARNNRDNPDEQFKIFKNIIENGLLFNKIQLTVSTSWVHNRCICFSDIPLTMMDDYVKDYGKFAIGFKKEFVKNNGGNPVFYFVDHNEARKPEMKYCLRGIINDNLSLIMEFAVGDFKILKKNGDEYNYKFLQNNLYQLLSYCKEIGDLGPPSDGSERVDSYFIEKEWRIVQYDLHKSAHRIKTAGKKQYLKLQIDDIRTIVVPNKNISKMVVKYMRNRGAINLPIIIEYDELKYL